MNYDSFSHGQIHSKVWLCEQLEPLIKPQSNVKILGSWYNILGFMMLVRQPKFYNRITGVDLDPHAIALSNRICDAWIINHDPALVSNEVGDANKVTYDDTDVVINCSAEHFEDSTWFDNILPGTTVCIQSSNMTDPNMPWLIKRASPTLESFLEKYPLTTIAYTGTLPIDYATWGYDRYMLIGIK